MPLHPTSSPLLPLRRLRTPPAMMTITTPHFLLRFDPSPRPRRRNPLLPLRPHERDKHSRPRRDFEPHARLPDRRASTRDALCLAHLLSLCIPPMRLKPNPNANTNPKSNADANATLHRGNKVQRSGGGRRRNVESIFCLFVVVVVFYYRRRDGAVVVCC